MTSRGIQLLTAAISLLALTTSAVPSVYPGHAECPWEKAQNKWPQFIAGAYGGGEPFFTIHFTRDVGDIWAGHCYFIMYRGNENWLAVGKVRPEPFTFKYFTFAYERRTLTVPLADTDKTKKEERHGGDPLKYKINVWRAIFTYNDAGEVYYDHDGERVGTMYCRIGTECWK
ncbi:hypothetical protein BB934_45850 (plasmid) [Microvirga ossetica]|uniref:Uncharacterized protein n=1 Tax=Microvirga ossetica TaxID=1882682 RepID=A0A1B2F021_9HYPH|nr:hypothetical protein [Microvirga ossetica]ANY85544.1 hypothetical protein BB934_45850 [Microvirga ossetica]